MTITAIHLFIAISAVWRLASLLANETGPFHLFKRIRRAAVRANNTSRFWHELHLYEGVTCEWCCSIWFGALVTAAWALMGDGLIILILPLALSTWAIVIKYVVQTLEQAREYAERLNKQTDTYKPVMDWMEDVLSNN